MRQARTLASTFFFSVVLIAHGAGLSLSARATSMEEDVRHSLKRIQLREQKIAEIMKSCEHCGVDTLSKCQRFYLEAYNKPVINVVVAVGYEDEDDKPDNWSDADHDNFVHRLKGPCRFKTDRMCEYKQSPEDPTLFVREMSINREPKTVQLRVVKGSSSAPIGSAEQKRHSALAKKTFLDGIATADIVMYQGHSRDSGGPDFSPADRIKGRINYPKYRKEQTGFKEVLQALANRPGKPLPVLILHSCSSSRHFRKGLQATSPNTRYILRHDVGYDYQGVPNMTNILEKLLRRSCGSELRSFLDSEDLDFVNFD